VKYNLYLYLDLEGILNQKWHEILAFKHGGFDQPFPDRSLTYTRNITWRAIVQAAFTDSLLKEAI
jgi:hypothetical protein